MSVTTFLLAVVSILLTTIGQAMLKHGMDRIGGFRAVNLCRVCNRW